MAMRNIYEQAPTPIRNFLGYLETTRNKSPSTVEEYFMDLRTFFRFIKLQRGLVPENADFETILIDDVDMDLIRSVTLTDTYEFFRYARVERHNQAAARARKVSSLKSFFQYLTVKAPESMRLKENPIKELDVPHQRKSLPKYLTLEQSLELLNCVDGPHKERDYCILTLLLNCGLRLSELVGLNGRDIRTDHTMRVVGKGNKERTVYLNQACLDALDRYLAVRAQEAKVIVDREALFLSSRGKRISPKTVQAMVYADLKKIGLDGQGYSVHKLRHTAATLMYQHGNVDIRALKEILGHENLATTEIYTHIVDEQLQKAVEANPLAHVKPRKEKKPE